MASHNHLNRCCKRLVAALCISMVAMRCVHAETLPQYYYSIGKNAEEGDAFGTGEDGDPVKWPSIHSQSSGEMIADHLRFAQKQNSNWTFLWTRKTSDTAAYDLVVNFHIRKEFVGRVALEIGFDSVYDHTQVAWPTGYWSSSENEWNTPFQPTAGESGSYVLNEENKSITVPAAVTKIYVRLRTIDEGKGGGFAWIESGSVVFNQAAAKTPPGAKPRAK